MAVFRVNKDSNYTTISNHHLRDKRLTLKAKGLLTLMLSLPDDWDYSAAGLVAICKEGEGAVKSALKELKVCGYLIIEKVNPDKSDNGRFDYIYNIYEQPVDNFVDNSKTQGKQGGRKQGVEIQALEKQGVENSGQLNTNNKRTKELKKENKDKWNGGLNQFVPPKPIECPDCGHRMYYNIQTARFACTICSRLQCPKCGEEVIFDRELDRYVCGC